MPATTPRQQPFPEADGKRKESSNGYTKPGFVRCDLSNDQKAEMAEWSNSRNSDDMLDYVDKSVVDGYQLSVKQTEQGFQASLTQTRQQAIHVPNAGKCLITRASTPMRALWSLYYKHTQVLVYDWTTAKDAQELEW